MTVKLPSSRADTFTQYARPLWTGGGGAFAAGAGIGATGNAFGWSSTTFAVKTPGGANS